MLDYVIKIMIIVILKCCEVGQLQICSNFKQNAALIVQSEENVLQVQAVHQVYDRIKICH